jgi:phage terminase large subunit-like protein
MFVDYGIDEGDDPFSEDTWKKANPNYGVSIEPETFRRTAKKAQNEVSFLNEFLSKHLNVWTTSVEAYFDMNKWNDTNIKLSSSINP